MPELSALSLAALILAAFVAGWVDAVVGGGGLIQLPALLIGLPSSTPPAVILGTNKVSSFCGTATSSLATKPNFAAIHAAADRAGHAAAKAAEPTPMIVRSGTTGEHWIIPGGVCGFAWVEVKGNTTSADGPRQPGSPTRATPAGSRSGSASAGSR